MNDFVNKHYSAWLLPEAERERLLKRFPAEYPDVIAHHVTESFLIAEDYALPTATTGVIVGIADDGEKVQALIIEIDGKTERGDSHFHITWSLDKSKGAKPFHSNALIKEHGWRLVDPITIVLEPKFLEK